MAAFVVGEPAEDADLDRAAPATLSHRGGVAGAEAGLLIALYRSDTARGAGPPRRDSPGVTGTQASEARNESRPTFLCPRRALTAVVHTEMRARDWRWPNPRPLAALFGDAVRVDAPG